MHKISTVSKTIMRTLSLLPNSLTILQTLKYQTHLLLTVPHLYTLTTRDLGLKKKVIWP